MVAVWLFFHKHLSLVSAPMTGNSEKASFYSSLVNWMLRIRYLFMNSVLVQWQYANSSMSCVQLLDMWEHVKLQLRLYC